MVDETTRFVYHWLHDVDKLLRRALESLKDDLRSDDDAVRRNAEKRAEMILDWLFPAPWPAGKDEFKLMAIEQAIKNKTISVDGRYKSVRRIITSTGRRRGRPRTEARHAILALSMHYATKLSWRKIALLVKGCNHTRNRPNLEISCPPCGDAIRDAAGRLEKFLVSIGFNPDFPRGDLKASDLSTLN